MYLHDHTQKKRVIWMWLAEHCTKDQDRAATYAATMMRPNEVTFS